MKVYLHGGPGDGRFIDLKELLTTILVPAYRPLLYPHPKTFKHENLGIKPGTMHCYKLQHYRRKNIHFQVYVSTVDFKAGNCFELSSKLVDKIIATYTHDFIEGGNSTVLHVDKMSIK